MVGRYRNPGIEASLDFIHLKQAMIRVGHADTIMTRDEFGKVIRNVEIVRDETTFEEFTD